MIEDLNSCGLIRDLAPDCQAAGTAGFDDAPLPADSHHTARQVLLAESLARGDFRHVTPRVELPGGDVAGETEGWLGLFPARAVVRDDVVLRHADHAPFR